MIQLIKHSEMLISPWVLASYISTIAIISMGSNDAMWRRKHWSSLVRIMAFHLLGTSHYLKQRWQCEINHLEKKSVILELRANYTQTIKFVLILVCKMVDISSRPQNVMQTKRSYLKHYHGVVEVIYDILTYLKYEYNLLYLYTK